jgi:hypothetical protein
MPKFFPVAALLIAWNSVPAHSSVLVFSEGFDDVTTLAGAGWATNNLSSPLGTTGYFQGNPVVFPAQSGAPDSYIGANFENATNVGTISDWLITPMLLLHDGDFLSFYTRTTTPGVPVFPDRLEVRFSGNGSSTNVGSTATSVGDFAALLLTINPTLTTTGYPSQWTQYVLTLSGLGAPTNGRFAFRYFVTNAGPNAPNADYIGIDNLTVTAIPEPVTSLLTAVGIVGFVLRKSRRR